MPLVFAGWRFEIVAAETTTTRATPSLYGWLVFWNTESVPNGTYTVHSIAYGNNGVVAASSDIVVQVANQK